jgi:hypothetical protein
VEQQPPSTEQTSSAERDAHRLRNGIIWTVALLVLLLAVGLAVPDLREVLDRVAHAQPSWFVLAVALEVASCLLIPAVATAAGSGSSSRYPGGPRGARVSAAVAAAVSPRFSSALRSE